MIFRKMQSSSSVSTKRARGVNNATQVAYCLVHGCNADLSNFRDYHRRHKVCEPHSKSPQVTVNGQKQRFCQQCSRFHSLEEFDEGKRSCRKRLDGHNRRRRKPKPDLLSHPVSALSSYKGTQVLPFTRTNVYPSTMLLSPTQPVVADTEADAASLRQQMNMTSKSSLHFGSSPSSRFKGGKEFPFLQYDSNPIVRYQTTSPPPPPPIPEASACEPLLRSIALSDSNWGDSYSIFCDKVKTTTKQQQQQQQQPNSGIQTAPSLLSSTQTQTSGNHMSQPNPTISLVRPVDPTDSFLGSNGRDAQSPSPSANEPLKFFHLTRSDNY